jgi:hypothetical protein
MTLQILDLALIGATTGFTTFIALVAAMKFMKRLDMKRKIVMFEEMVGQMHEKAEAEQKFSEIVEEFRKSQGQE